MLDKDVHFEIKIDLSHDMLSRFTVFAYEFHSIQMYR